MTIQETERAVVNYESGENRALIAIAPSHACFHRHFGCIRDIGLLGSPDEEKSLQL